MFITTAPMTLSEAPTRRPGRRVGDALASAATLMRTTLSHVTKRPASGDPASQTPSDEALRSAHEPITWYR